MRAAAPARTTIARSRTRGAVANGVPDSHPSDGEADVLFRRDRRHGEQCEGPQASLVEVPPCVQEERARERDRMEVAQGQPLHRRVGEIGDCECGSRPLQIEVLAREPVDRDRAGGDGDRLHDEQELGIRPHPPERSKRGEDRVEVRAEPGDLLAVDVSDREEVAVRGRPHGLGHVSEVEASAVEAAVPEDGSRAEDARKGGSREPDDRDRLHLRTSCSTRPRHRSPSTASLARAR